MRLLTTRRYYTMACTIYRQYVDHTFAVSEPKLQLDLSQYDYSHTFYYTVAAFYSNDYMGAWTAANLLLDKDQLLLEKRVQNLLNISQMTKALESLETMALLSFYGRYASSTNAAIAHTRSLGNDPAVDPRSIDRLERSTSALASACAQRMHAFAPFRLQLASPPVDIVVCIVCVRSLDTLKSISYTWVDLFRARQVCVLLSGTLAQPEAIETIHRAFPRARLVRHLTSTIGWSEMLSSVRGMLAESNSS
jgi:hypothetical protein